LKLFSDFNLSNYFLSLLEVSLLEFILSYDCLDFKFGL
jgi:hypothetical protein